MTHPTILRSSDHRYTYEGVTYPGVTDVLRIIDKSDALMAWAARNTAEAAVALMEADGGQTLLNTVGPEGTIKALSSRSSWKRDQAAAKGSQIHALAELVVSGQPVPASPHRAQVEHYASWWSNSGWTLRATEGMIVNPELGYGGTFDLLARDADKRTVLADIKTGNVYKEVVLQLAAYSMGHVVQVGAAAYKMPAVDRYVVLHVTAEGVRVVEVAVGSVERGAFAACLELYRWAQSMKGIRL